MLSSSIVLMICIVENKHRDKKTYETTFSRLAASSNIYISRQTFVRHSFYWCSYSFDGQIVALHRMTWNSY